MIAPLDTLIQRLQQAKNVADRIGSEGNSPAHTFSAELVNRIALIKEGNFRETGQVRDWFLPDSTFIKLTGKEGATLASDIIDAIHPYHEMPAFNWAGGSTSWNGLLLRTQAETENSWNWDVTLKDGSKSNPIDSSINYNDIWLDEVSAQNAAQLTAVQYLELKEIDLRKGIVTGKSKGCLAFIAVIVAGIFICLL